jgi:hypothetical protein
MMEEKMVELERKTTNVEVVKSRRWSVATRKSCQ